MGRISVKLFNGLVGQIGKWSFPKMIGKVETGTINKKRRKTMTVVLEVEVTTNITHINPQQTNSLKMTKKNGPH